MTKELYTSRVPLVRAVMGLAHSWAQARSKSPRTKVGAVLYCPTTGQMAFGYNGLPSGVEDSRELWDDQDPDSPTSYLRLVQHAEMNCVRKAWQQGGFDFPHAFLCVTLYPCHHCMKDFIIPSGIKTVWFDQYHRSNQNGPDPTTETLARLTGVVISQLPPA